MTYDPKVHFLDNRVPDWALKETARPPIRSGTGKVTSGQSVLLRIPEAAANLNISEKTVRRLITAGTLQVVRIGRLIRIQPAEVERFLAQASHPVTAPVRERKEKGRG